MLRLCSILNRRQESQIELGKDGLGFSLPINMGDLDPAETVLNLYNLNLTGNKQKMGDGLLVLKNFYLPM